MVYILGDQLGLQRECIDKMITKKLGNYSQYSKSIMNADKSIYKAGTHYGTVSIYDFK